MYVPRLSRIFAKRTQKRKVTSPSGSSRKQQIYADSARAWPASAAAWKKSDKGGWSDAAASWPVVGGLALPFGYWPAAILPYRPILLA